VRKTARTPTGEPFCPVGHLSLDSKDPGYKELGIPIPGDGAYWIKSLYVLDRLRSGGIARAAMDQVEKEAIDPPLNARHILMDTVHKNDARNPAMSDAFYGGPPKVCVAPPVG
jgi:hypothetical protein